MKLKKCNNMVVSQGLCCVIGAKTKIEVENFCGDERVLLNDTTYRMKSGMTEIDLTDFREDENSIKLYSGGKWYSIPGIVRKDGKLKYSEAFLQETVEKQRLLIHQLLCRVEDAEKRIAEMEKRITGESFL